MLYIWRNLLNEGKRIRIESIANAIKSKEWAEILPTFFLPRVSEFLKEKKKNGKLKFDEKRIIF